MQKHNQTPKNHSGKFTVALAVFVLCAVGIYFWAGQGSKKTQPDQTQDLAQEQAQDQTQAEAMPEQEAPSALTTAQTTPPEVEQTETTPVAPAPVAAEPKSTGFFGKLLGKKNTQSPEAAGGKIGLKTPGQYFGKDGTDHLGTNLPQVTQQAEEASGCYTVSFKHKKIDSHANGVACTKHKNLLSLGEGLAINPKSICLKVNGVPVKFNRNPSNANEIVFGSIAGPDSVVTARYCIGKSNCGEKCVVPKDDFLDAIGAGTDEFDDEMPVVQWDPNKDKKVAKKDEKVDSELKSLKTEMAKGSVSIERQNFFKDWLGNKPERSCMQAAMVDGPNRSLAAAAKKADKLVKDAR